MAITIITDSKEIAAMLFSDDHCTAGRIDDETARRAVVRGELQLAAARVDLTTKHNGGWHFVTVLDGGQTLALEPIGCTLPEDMDEAHDEDQRRQKTARRLLFSLLRSKARSATTCTRTEALELMSTWAGDSAALSALVRLTRAREIDSRAGILSLPYEADRQARLHD